MTGKRKKRFQMRLLSVLLTAGMLTGSIGTSAFAAADEMADVTVTTEATADVTTVVTDENPVDVTQTPGGASETPETEDGGPAEDTEGTRTEEPDVKEDPDTPAETVDLPVEEDPDEPAETVEPPAEEDPDEPAETVDPPVEEDPDEPAETVEPPAEEKPDGPAETVGTEPVEYATLDEFNAAVAAMGDADDLESVLIVLDNCLSIYARMSPEDQAGKAAEYNYIVGYREAVVAGNPDVDIETAALISGEQFTVNVVKVVNGEKVDKKTLTTTCLQSYGHSGYVHSTNLRTLANESGFSGYNGYSWSPYTTVPSKYTSGLVPNNNYASVHYNITGSAPYKANETLYLFFEEERKTFTLHYNANGGSRAPASQTATGTETSYQFMISQSQPTRTGYTFRGWSESSSATSPSYFGGGTINVTGTTTLYAVWERNVEKVTLTYDANGGNNPPSGQTADKGTEFTIKGAEGMTRSNYKFLGWNTDPNAKEADFRPGDTVKLNVNTTLYAVWEEEAPIPASYLVEWYDTEGNKLKTDTRYDKIGEMVAVTEDDKNYDGYTFDHDNAGNILTATLTAGGTVLKLYFTKNLPVDNGMGITVTKDRTSADTAEVGDTITWEIEVENNSNVEKTVELTEQDGVILSESKVTLAAGQTKTVTASYLVTGDEILINGKFYNTVRATTGGEGDNENAKDTDQGTEIISPDQTKTIPVTPTVTFIVEGEDRVLTREQISEDYVLIFTYTDMDGEHTQTFKGSDAAWGGTDCLTATWPSFDMKVPDVAGGHVMIDVTQSGYLIGNNSEFAYNRTYTANGGNSKDGSGAIKVSKVSHAATVDTRNFYNVPQELPALTGITKELVGSVPTSVKVGESVTLTYKITVTGDNGANYTVRDPGTTLVSGSWTGTLDESGKAEITVTKTVTAAETGTMTVRNTAYVKPGENTRPVDPDDPIDGHPSNEVVTVIPVTDPEEPTNPTDPEEPTNPTDPEEPTNPTDPEEPTNPTDPEEPTNPTDPEEPTNPTDPEEPTNPTDPEETVPEEPVPEPVPANVVPEPVPIAPVVPVVTPVEPTDVPAVPVESIEENTTPLAESEVSEEEVLPVSEEIEDAVLPLAEGRGRSWALVNFALMNLAVFETLMLLIGYFVNTKKASEEEEEEQEKKLKKKGVVRLISLPVAVISVIAFCLTEDITLPTGFVDRWTLLMAIIAVVQTVVVALSRKKEEEEDARG